MMAWRGQLADSTADEWPGVGDHQKIAAMATMLATLEVSYKRTNLHRVQSNLERITEHLKSPVIVALAKPYQVIVGKSNLAYHFMNKVTGIHGKTANEARQ